MFLLKWGFSAENNLSASKLVTGLMSATSAAELPRPTGF